VRDISPLRGLTNLINLDLGINFIKDIGPLNNLVNLKSLSLYRNEELSQIESVGNLTGLVYLDLGYNNVEDISCLSKLVNLKELYLEENNIKSVKSLAGLSKLETLKLDKNPIEDYSPVARFLGPGQLETPTPTPIATGININPLDNLTSKPYTTPTPTNKAGVTPTPTIKPRVIEPESKVPSSVEFKDISGHWARNSIAKLLERGIITGYPDGTLRPNSEISRAEIVVMLVKAVDLKVDGSSGLSFNDNKEIPSWARKYVNTAVENDIIKGFDNNTFRPSLKLTRQEMAVMALRAFDYEESSGESIGFKDSDDIPQWAKGFISKAVELEIIKGYKDNTFKPDKKITRAEACTIISKCLK
jgi:hypothetical protein